MTRPRTDGPAPLIALPGDLTGDDGLLFHKVGDKYVRPLAEISGAVPLMVPALGSLLNLRELVARLDGVVVTGALSNVHPDHYGAPVSPESEPYDPARDATSLDLIRLAIEQEVPLFAICRGLQELNVALGGTLISEVQSAHGRLDHRAPEERELDLRYGPRHPVSILAGGLLYRILACEEIEVNSLHRQAIDRLARPLEAEASAPDGTIEAVSVRDAATFALGVQWHPEYRATENEVSLRLFKAFGEAARARAAQRTPAARA